MRIPQRVKFFAKAVATVGLFALAISSVGTDAILSVTTEIDPVWVLGAVCLVGVIVLLEALQFKEVARLHGHELPYPTSLYMTLVGRFFSLFTPAMVGTDIYRAASMHQRGSGMRHAVGTVAAARIMSLVALIPVLLAGLPAIASVLGMGLPLLVAAGVTGTALLGTVALVLLAIFGRPLVERLRYALVRHAVNLADDIIQVVSVPPPRSWAWVTATAQHLVRVLAFTALGQAYGLDAGVIVFFALVPVSLLLAMVPISLGSWGLREVTLIYSLGLVGVPGAEALAVSVTFGLIGLSYGLSGGVLWGLSSGQSGPHSPPGETERPT
ncbi:MAG: lysylphosphatidylglycerol synthase transmembrane domain-containing protein [Pseudomonadota bacterium]